eukprot:UN27878
MLYVLVCLVYFRLLHLFYLYLHHHYLHHLFYPIMVRLPLLLHHPSKSIFVSSFFIFI